MYWFLSPVNYLALGQDSDPRAHNAITNPHSPLEDRIKGVVSNIPEFQKAFSCKPGQQMVRTQACRVW